MGVYDEFWTKSCRREHSDQLEREFLLDVLRISSSDSAETWQGSVEPRLTSQPIRPSRIRGNNSREIIPVLAEAKLTSYKMK